MVSNTATVNRFLYFTVFTSGMVTLAVEFSASRLLGNVFGASNLIWAMIVGLMLLYLTVGYFLGGRWADRSPSYVTLYRILVWGAFLCALIPLAARPVLRLAATAIFEVDAGIAAGAFIAVVILFALPITLLGTVSPFAIRLAIHDPQHVGRVSGTIYAISTLGSLIGTFLPELVIIPQLGTFLTFVLFAGILYLVALIGLARQTGARAAFWLWMPLVTGLLSFLVLSGPLREPQEGFTLLYDGETPYNYVQVQESPSGYRYLYLNEGQGVHSIYHPTIYRYNGTWDYFLAAPYFNADHTPDEVESLLVIGLAAGTIPRQYQHVYGDIPMVGIEIDPGIIEVGRDYFDMNMPSLTTYAQDGRFVLTRLEQEFSVVAIDAYRPPYIPWHLTTVEFFREVRAHLTDDGVVAINVGRAPEDRRLIDALARVLTEVYPSVYAVDVPNSLNTILIGTVQPTTADNLVQNIANLPADVPLLLREVLVSTTESLVPVEPADLLFTDDRAPVETLVDSLVLNFLLNGDLSVIQ